jgi:hypothetical protein
MARPARPVEIDETDLQRSEALRRTVTALMTNPKSRPLMLQAQKAAFPQLPVPEIDSAQPYVQALQGLNKKIDDFIVGQAKAATDRKAADDQAAFNSKIEAGRAKLRKAGVTDEGLKKIEELMQQHGIVDHDAGLAYFEKLNPPPPPVTPSAGFGSWNFLGAPDGASKEEAADVQRLIESKGEDEFIIRKMADKAIAEVRNAR